LKKVGHGVGIRKVKDGILSKHPKCSLLTPGLHLVKVNDSNVSQLDVETVLNIINKAAESGEVLATFSTFKPKEALNSAVKKIIAVNRSKKVSQ
jgi:hypothetical protein